MPMTCERRSFGEMKYSHIFKFHIDLRHDLFRTSPHFIIKLMTKLTRKINEFVYLESLIEPLSVMHDAITAVLMGE